jgi:hypothetical protein
MASTTYAGFATDDKFDDDEVDTSDDEPEIYLDEAAFLTAQPAASEEITSFDHARSSSRQARLATSGISGPSRVQIPESDSSSVDRSFLDL